MADVLVQAKLAKQSLQSQSVWKGVRVVDGVGFENQCGVSYRGFESHPFRCLLGLRFSLFRSRGELLVKLPALVCEVLNAGQN